MIFSLNVLDLLFFLFFLLVIIYHFNYTFDHTGQPFARSLTQFVRHCSVHLPDHSVTRLVLLTQPVRFRPGQAFALRMQPFSCFPYSLIVALGLHHMNIIPSYLHLTCGKTYHCISNDLSTAVNGSLYTGIFQGDFCIKCILNDLGT